MDNKDKKTRNFRLSMIDAVSHERLWSLRFSRRGAIIAAISAAVVLIGLIFSIIAFTPIRTFIPGYPDARTRRQAVQNARRVDSLETRILQWELYTENLRRVVTGRAPIRLDSLILQNQASREAVDSVYLAMRDSALRADVAAEEQFYVSGEARNLPIEAQAFFPPVRGVVSNPFDRALHPYLDITAPAGEVVTAVLDGTVIFSSRDDDNGYTLAIQHKGDIISFYKHNQKLLRKPGDAVKAGAPVALVGSSESLTSGDHLRFELWYDGEPVDPTLYITF